MSQDLREIPPRRHFHYAGPVPGDKSITHRAYLLSLLARGETEIRGALRSADTDATLRAVVQLGAQARESAGAVAVRGTGGRITEPTAAVDCANAGTLMRLLAGLLAPRGALVVLTGDESLSRRPMGRVVEPLRALGARIHARGGDRLAPIAVLPAEMDGGEISLPLPSAQVKSLVLLAALGARGETRITDLLPTRDHTERMLESFGARLEAAGGTIRLPGRQQLESPGVLEVPGDISHAAFLLAAAALADGGEAEIRGVGLNPGRAGVLAVLERMGLQVEIGRERERPEPVGTVRLRAASLRGVRIRPQEVPGLIDELPVIAALGLVAEGRTEVSGAGELRHKESDRIRALRLLAEAVGGRFEETEDGFRIEGTGGRIRGGTVDSLGDHRIAMAAAILSLRAERPITVLGASASAVSFPDFYPILERSSS